MRKAFPVHGTPAVEAPEGVDLAQALVALGVARAAVSRLGEPPKTERSVRAWLSKVVARTDPIPCAPVELGTETAGALASLPAATLTRAWTLVAGEVKRDLRLALEPVGESAALSEPGLGAGLGISWLLPRLAWHASSIYAPEASPGHIASCVFLLPRKHLRPTWEWPLRIGVLSERGGAPLENVLRQSHMVQRGMATVTVVGREDVDCDLLLMSGRLRDAAGQLRTMQADVQAGAVVSLRESARTLPEVGDAIEGIRETVRAAGFAAADVPLHRIATWTEAVLRGLSHNRPLDVALWQADAVLRGQGQFEMHTPPLIFAEEGLLDASRLSAQVARLTERLNRLPRSVSVYVSDTASQRLLIASGSLPGKRIAKLLRKASPQYAYHYESDEATGVADLGHSVEAAEREAAPALTRVAWLPRYADLTFIDSLQPQAPPLAAEEPLMQGRTYLLEVAVRAVRTGISYVGPPPKALPIPPSDHDITLLAVVYASPEDFDVPEPVQLIVLPPDDDSRVNARFAVTPRRRSTDRQQLSRFEVRLYYELNLLEFLVVSVEVVGAGALPVRSSLFGLSRPIFIEQQTFYRSYGDLRRALAPREMHVHITRDGAQYVFNFVVRTGEFDQMDERTEVRFPARRRLDPSDLADKLQRLRDDWHDIALGRHYATELDPPEYAFRQSLRALAERGRSFWTLLFRGDQRSAIWHVGEWLQQHPLARGSLVQITLAHNAADFVFPWSLLYDRALPEDNNALPDPDGFWGLRYQVEQQIDGLVPLQLDQPASLGSRPLELAFMLYAGFQHSEEQQLLVESLSQKSKGRISVVQPSPIDDPKRFCAYLESCDADLLYFYTHGHTRSPQAEAGTAAWQMIVSRYQALQDGDAGKTALKPLYDLVTAPDFKADDSWIGLTHGHVRLEDLQAASVGLKAGPIVILNACESAQVVPTVAESFVSFFLGRGARSVVGTECPMTAVFAHPFSKELLRRLASGAAIGDALVQARRVFVDRRNPLGLAYTLFGSATARYSPAPLPPEEGP